MPTRRDFLTSAGAAGAALLAGLTPARALAALESAGRAPAPLDILVLGGTGFIGPYIVRYAVSRGHRVTIFTRGKHQADIPDSVIRLQGDRNGQLGALAGKHWDAVIDDSGNVADWVRQSTDFLKGSAGQYLFTSSTGAYYPYLKRGLDESDPVHTDLHDPKDGSESYGVMKALGEKYTMDAFGAGGIVVRPSYIVGPGDTSDRFTYWPVRLAQGGEVLAPGKPNDPVQFIDVRDLTTFMVGLVEQKKGGIYNAAGPLKPMVAPEFYRGAATALDAKVTWTWIDDYAFLKDHQIEYSIPWCMLQGNDDGMMSIRFDRAVAAGLTLRPMTETLRDTLAWWRTLPEERRAKNRFVIKPEMEAKALADWKARGT